MASMDNCPKPQIVEDPPTQNNTDQPGNSNVEKFVQFQYWFPSLGEPNTNTCTFNTEEEFLRAVLTAKEPTLIYTNSKTENDWSLSLPKIFPLYFPYGVGGIKEGRANKVSDIECMRHYLRLSLPQFQKADFILVLCQMYLRRAAFQSAYVSSIIQVKIRWIMCCSVWVNLIQQLDLFYEPYQLPAEKYHIWMKQQRLPEQRCLDYG